MNNAYEGVKAHIDILAELAEAGYRDCLFDIQSKPMTAEETAYCKGMAAVYDDYACRIKSVSEHLTWAMEGKA